MVNLNSIEKIMRYINENNIRPMKKWSLRNQNCTNTRYLAFKNLKNKIRDLLILLSGNDVISMLKGFSFILNKLKKRFY